MKKAGERKKLTLLILITLIITAALIIHIFPKLVGHVIKEKEKQVRFYFYDETGCPLNGYVFSGSNLIGKTYKGFFNLTYENYKENLNPKENISIFGKLGDCFNGNEDLFFDRYWKAFEIKEHYFSGDSVFNFKTKINPHNPAKRELLGFIRPDKIGSEISKINLKKENTLNDLSEINQYLNNKTSYTKDWKFKEENYWQTPLETLSLEKGDCEDYSSTLLSLFLAYDNSLNCHNIIFSSHVTTFCKIENYYIYYDQGKTELKKEINGKREETETQLEKLKQEYFEHYGINETKRVYYAFNDNKYIEFESEEEFIDWQFNLDNKKSGIKLFEKLAQEAVEIEERYAIGELATEKPSLPTEKPTLKRFLAENIVLILSLLLISILLIITLIKINKK